MLALVLFNFQEKPTERYVSNADTAVQSPPEVDDGSDTSSSNGVDDDKNKTLSPPSAMRIASGSSTYVAQGDFAYPEYCQTTINADSQVYAAVNAPHASSSSNMIESDYPPSGHYLAGTYANMVDPGSLHSPYTINPLLGTSNPSERVPETFTGPSVSDDAQGHSPAEWHGTTYQGLTQSPPTWYDYPGPSLAIGEDVSSIQTPEMPPFPDASFTHRMGHDCGQMAVAPPAMQWSRSFPSDGHYRVQASIPSSSLLHQSSGRPGQRSQGPDFESAPEPSEAGARSQSAGGIISRSFSLNGLPPCDGDQEREGMAPLEKPTVLMPGAWMPIELYDEAEPRR
ncbi:hypothetical protein PUNSTDRAFT_133713 [Punctularia strigosozonata HHB-11173 SS5]|uniref:uncharacterized protein n=1 Tax=Punctularia strigosozonata (strain HHB-11173) TaxID=741275 RepID=UPI00044163E3|nr:uncharacterized protein PUNSTDRAFT_133713 [Punctularia strigosozonata HHB-11173 SS5]EIN09941.1 hypothetical protein PUNSTDRAFT_133713 [Punctularia strigosozonata HHB-11173 SS5]